MSTFTKTLSRAITCCVAAILPAAAASAAVTPEELVDACLNRMMNATHLTVESINEAGDRGVNRIETLDENDQPVPVMRRAAVKANTQIEQREIKGDRTVNQAADKCIRILVRHDADPELIAMINGARAESVGAIHAASIAGHEAVRGALETALEDENIPAGEAS
ncbi:MAG: hypothetical protein H6813_04035 [Phycisphaeraceae bacterium]|nr:hypothetical protein [Phycisphaeraceae bacterium]MCB9847116.1 hypothetical protein [Phycisphaeraceae bacterium]